VSQCPKEIMEKREEYVPNASISNDKKQIYFFIMIECVENVIWQTTQQIDNEP
jgi:hypothetical protein